jgi:hypothetical protein
VFDTETMAELCVKQGQVDQAIAIYRRMAGAAQESSARRRFEERIAELERQPGQAPLETPGLRIQVRFGDVEIEWRLPTETQRPALQLLLLRRTVDGIQADARTLQLASPHGLTKIVASDLHTVRAAAGRMEGETFVPIVRLPGLPPSRL